MLLDSIFPMGIWWTVKSYSKKFVYVDHAFDPDAFDLVHF